MQLIDHVVKILDANKLLKMYVCRFFHEVFDLLIMHGVVNEN
jgi:hypothetical protein